MIAASQACIKITSWSSTNACYACTNCANPFSATASGVTSAACNSYTVACAVSFLLNCLSNFTNNFFFLQKKVYPSGAVDRFCASICSEGTDASNNQIHCCYGSLCNHSSRLSFSPVQKIAISALALITLLPLLF